MKMVPSPDRHVWWCGRIRGCASTEWHAVVQLSGTTLSVTVTDLSATYTGNVVVVQQHDGDKKQDASAATAASITTSASASATQTNSTATVQTTGDIMAVLRQCLMTNRDWDNDHDNDNDNAKTKTKSASVHRLIRVTDRINMSATHNNNNNNKQLRISTTWGCTTPTTTTSGGQVLLPSDLCIDLDIIIVDLQMQAASTLPFMHCMMTCLTKSRTQLHKLSHMSHTLDTQINDIEQAKLRIDQTMTTEAKQTRRRVFLNALNMYKNKNC